MSKPILTLEKINKEFIMGQHSVQVLRMVSLEIEVGEAVAIVGPSGAGKTTMLNIAGGLLSPSSGSVKIKDHELSGQSDEALAKLRNHLVGFIFQLHHLLPEFNAIENVALPALISGKDKSCYRHAMKLLDEVGLGHRHHHRPGELSGGEQQRVAIARALMNKPKLLLADEPTGDLDGPTANEIHDLLLNLNKKHGQTLIMVTHNPELANRADRIINMKDGVIHGQNKKTEF